MTATPWRKLPACETNGDGLINRPLANPASSHNSRLRFDTLLLVLVACATLMVARASGASSPTPMVFRALGELIAILAVSLLLCRQAKSLMQARGFAALAACVAMVFPLAVEFTLRQFGAGNEPLEILMLTGLQLMAVALAVFRGVPRLGGSAVLLSSFLLLSVVTMDSNRTALALASIFGVLVLWWLMGNYWDRLTGTFVASTTESRLPMRVSIIAGLGIVLLLLAVMIGSTGGVAFALPGFMPTSGGTQSNDPYARSGIGDGDAMVAAKENAMSFGPVESELFLESCMPSLYDMFSDIYGEPLKPKKKQERNIGLGASEVKQINQQIAKTERSGREFSAVRRKVQRKQQSLSDRSAPAMLYVVGRVPLHLALERFDTFDGRDWTHSGVAETQPLIRLETQHGKPWAYLQIVESNAIYCGIEPHAVKIINLKSNRFPSPPQLTAVHVDKVDQPDFFGWTDDGIACMPVRDHIPQLTVMQLRSQIVNLQPLREESFPIACEPTSYHWQSESLRLGDSERETRLNWQQVEKVIDQLRTEFIHDPSSTAPADCEDVVAHFLESKRGPAYLFATTAAMMLRERGFQTRLVTGFYADKDRYENVAAQTAVLAEDVHVWVEVSIDGRIWVPVEPTPGYEPPRESLTWWQLASKSLVMCVAWVVKNFVSILVVIMFCVLLFVTRCAWLDALAVCVCSVMGRSSVRARLLWTIRLLEWRAWLVGRSRPKQSTVAAWYAPLIPAAAANLRPAMSEFLVWTDRLQYSPAGVDAAQRNAIDAACRSAVSASSRKSLALSFFHPTASH